MDHPELDITATMTALEPYLALLSGAVRRGFQTYQDLYPPLVKADHDNAAAAKNVHRHILTEIETAIVDVRGLAVINARGLSVLNIHDAAVVRFKKMNEEGRSESYPTAQARAFDRQLPLPNLPSAIRLTFGYEPDLAFSQIVRVLTACPLGGKALWCVQVNEDSSGASSWVDITPRRFKGTEGFRRYGTDDV